MSLRLPLLLPHGSWEPYYWLAVPLLLICGGAASNWIVTGFKQWLPKPWHMP